MIANDPAFPGGMWMINPGSLDWTVVPKPDQTATVYALFRDRDGNISPLKHDSIIVDPDGDLDNDTVPDSRDNCPRKWNPDQKDSDGDKAGDVCDNCPNASNSDQKDTDKDGIGNVCDNCPLYFNPDQKDVDADGVGDVCDGCPNDPKKTSPGICGCGIPDTDSDGDGISDCIDSCPASKLTATIIIGRCNTGVKNQLFPDGCTMSDLLAQCAAGAKNHGVFVSCVAHLTNDWKKQGLITGKEKGKIESCAAKTK
jgi:hypothetical protein